MKKYLLLLFIAVTTDCLSQDSLSRWSFGLMGGVEQCGRLLNHIEGDQDAIDQWNSLEKNVWRLSGGLRAERKLSEHFSLLTGLNYTDRGYSIDTLKESSLNDLNFHFRYVEVPIGVIYTGKSFGKNALLASAGISLGYAVYNVLFYRKDGQSALFDMQAVSDTNPFQANVSAALGVRRAITNSANADFYLSGNQSMLSLAQGSLERRFYAVGFYIAVTSRF
jgi:hypothetical protein